MSATVNRLPILVFLESHNDIKAYQSYVEILHESVALGYDTLAIEWGRNWTLDESIANTEAFILKSYKRLNTTLQTFAADIVKPLPSTFTGNIRQLQVVGLPEICRQLLEQVKIDASKIIDWHAQRYIADLLSCFVPCSEWRFLPELPTAEIELRIMQSMRGVLEIINIDIPHAVGGSAYDFLVSDAGMRIRDAKMVEALAELSSQGANTILRVGADHFAGLRRELGNHKLLHRPVFVLMGSDRNVDSCEQSYLTSCPGCTYHTIRLSDGPITEEQMQFIRDLVANNTQLAMAADSASPKFTPMNDSAGGTHPVISSQPPLIVENGQLHLPNGSVLSTQGSDELLSFMVFSLATLLLLRQVLRLALRNEQKPGPT